LRWQHAESHGNPLAQYNREVAELLRKSSLETTDSSLITVTPNPKLAALYKANKVQNKWQQKTVTENLFLELSKGAQHLSIKEDTNQLG
jgi:hypothetical protein